MKTKAFFEKQTSTLTYVVWDETTRDAVIIDPVMDYESGGSTYDYASIDEVMEFVKSNELKVHYILETHAHADHLTGAQELKRRLPEAKVAIGDHIPLVQQAFKKIYNLGDEFQVDGSQFDQLLTEGETINAGSLQFKVMHTPGHTPACSSYVFDKQVFTGDALFMPDFGVARCDFPGGSAKELYNSVKNKLYSLPDDTKVYTGHDYQPGGRELQYESTIGESKRRNIHLNAGTTEEEFIKFRTERDKTLAAPKLLLPSIEVNVDAGRLPKPENNGVSYLKIPIRKKGG